MSSTAIRPLGEFSKSIGDVERFLGLPESSNELRFTGVSADSRAVQPGDLFIAAPGATPNSAHGSAFVEAAVKNGAVAVLSDVSISTTITETLGVPVVTTAHLKSIIGDYIGEIASWFYQSPSRAIACVGITGTNGKTTTATVLKQLWDRDGRSTGLIGTLGIDLAGEFHSGTHTTPMAPELQAVVETMRERHIRNLAMEVSSHALVQGRVRGMRFDIVAFTNLSQDHLDFHGTMENYFQAKASLFTNQYAERAVINIDDDYGRRLLGLATIPVVTLSRIDRKANWFYERVESEVNGFSVAIRGESGVLIEGFLPFLGEHNLDNVLMAVAIATMQGVDPLVIASSLPTLQSVSGRLEMVNVGQDFQAVVDFAHSPDSVERILRTLRASTQARGGRLIAVLGCGGDRDKSKRPIMGRALLEGSDVAIFTSDNPRSEDAREILNEMTHGLSMKDESAVEVDRRAAIALAVATAMPGDTVVVLGKGHETGQEISGVKYPFDDRVELAQAIEALR